MNMFPRCTFWIIVFVALSFNSHAAGEEVAGEEVAAEEVTERHRKVVQEVFDRVVDVTEQPEGWDQWPPLIAVKNFGQINAFAGPKSASRKQIPQIIVYRGLIEKIADFDSDVLALTLCHEFGHLLKFHSRKSIKHQKEYGSLGAAIAIMAVNREHELEADTFGAELTLKAGYSREGIRKNLKAWMESGVVEGYSPFDALQLDHPSWEQRAAYVEKGTSHEVLWHSMGTFRDGVRFLAVEDYGHATDCFLQVVDEFPQCFEGWANLGYSFLMEHVDNLTQEEIRERDIGHLVVGCFYRDPLTLQALCTCSDLESKKTGKVSISITGDLLDKARAAFKQAAKNQHNLANEIDTVLLEANVAVAELVDSAKESTAAADKLFAGVAKKLNATSDEASDPIARAAAWINIGVGSEMDDALIKQALRELRHASSQKGVKLKNIRTLEAALHYTHALRLAESDNPEDWKSAVQMLESFLETMLPTDAWWPQAYSHYENLVLQLGESPKPKSEFYKLTVHDWRPVSSVVMEDGKLVGLSQATTNAFSVLGEADRSEPIIQGEQLRRHYFEGLGVSILGCREVLAIFLDSGDAPSLMIARPGMGGAREEISVGMSRSKLEKLVGDEWSVEFTSIDDPDTLYHFYRTVGIAARYEEGKVVTLVVVAVPPKG